MQAGFSILVASASIVAKQRSANASDCNSATSFFSYLFISSST